MSVDSQEDFTPNETCPLCYAEGGQFIGYLGNTPWYRCRMCGDVFTTEGGYEDAGSEADKVEAG